MAAQDGAMTGPTPGRGLGRQAPLDRLAQDVAANRRHKGAGLDQDGAVATLKEVAGGAVTAMKALSIAPVNLAHPARQRRRLGPHHQLIALRQQAVSQAAPLETPTGLGNDVEKLFRVRRRVPVAVVAPSGEHTINES